MCEVRRIDIHLVWSRAMQFLRNSTQVRTHVVPDVGSRSRAADPVLAAGDQNLPEIVNYQPVGQGLHVRYLMFCRPLQHDLDHAAHTVRCKLDTESSVMQDQTSRQPERPRYWMGDFLDACAVCSCQHALPAICAGAGSVLACLLQTTPFVQE